MYRKRMSTDIESREEEQQLNAIIYNRKDEASRKMCAKELTGSRMEGMTWITQVLTEHVQYLFENG